MEKLFNHVSIIFGAVGGTLASLLGGFDKWLWALAVFVVLDYLTGVVKAVYNKKLSSKIGFKGICGKLVIFAVVSVSVILQGLIDNSLPLRDMTVCFYIANEGISLLENMAEFTAMPEKLKSVLLQLRNKGKQNNEASINYAYEQLLFNRCLQAPRL